MDELTLTLLWAEADERTKASLALTYLSSLMKGVNMGTQLDLNITTNDDKAFKFTVVEMPYVGEPEEAS